MKSKLTTSVLVIALLNFSLTGCNKVSNGVAPIPAANVFLKGADGPPLWFVDNIEVPTPSTNGKPVVDPNDIRDVTVLSPDSNSDLISKYGAKGKNGIVRITTKKGSK